MNWNKIEFNLELKIPMSEYLHNAVQNYIDYGYVTLCWDLFIANTCRNHAREHYWVLMC